MYVVEEKGDAVALMVVALIFLGTWPAIMNFLERKGRLPQHTYLDYCITNYLAAVIFAFTLGQIGSSKPDSPNFLSQLKQKNGSSVGFAMTGGVVLCLGNLSLQYALAYVGLSIAEVITCSLTVVAGTTMNYFLDDRINKAKILFPGVGLFLVAILLGSALHASNLTDNSAKMARAQIADAHKEGLDDDDALESAAKTDRNTSDVEEKLDGGALVANEVKVSGGSVEFLKQIEKRRAIKHTGSSTVLGLLITFFAGGCFSLFSPAFNLATNDQWHTLKPGVPHLVVYTAFFYFSTSFFFLAAALNIFFLYYPLLGLPKSSISNYIADSKGRAWALLAGLLCGFGNGLQFMGGQAAGYAAADAVQAMPLVSTIWAVLIFREYYRSSRRTYILLVSMLLMFVLAVAMLMASSGKRKTS